MAQIRHSVYDEPFFLVRTLAAAGEGGLIRPHTHDWGQLVFVREGAATLAAEDGSWVAPAGAALWVAPGKMHSLRFGVRSNYVSLYLRSDRAETAVAGGSAAVAPTPLLAALVDFAAAAGTLDARRPAERAAATLLAFQIAEHQADRLALPLPKSAKLRRVADIALDGARGARTGSSALASEQGLSLRSLERRFFAETGVSIGRWRARARMQKALQRLSSGASVKETAAALGYSSPSAFVAAFRRTFGASPARYVKNR